MLDPLPTFVDTNVILDVLTDDPTWGLWAAEALEAIGDEVPLIINQVVYAEAAPHFARIEDLDSALSVFTRENVPWARLLHRRPCLPQGLRATHARPEALPPGFPSTRTHLPGGVNQPPARSVADSVPSADVDAFAGAYSPGVTRPASYARTTACTRSRRWSLARQFETWVFTVASPRKSSEAISALL